MPDTYAELRARYGLGADPYDPRDNLLAGTAYLRELYDRFGAPGFIAAYNAGPGRVGELLTRGRQLPDETQRYLAAIRRTPAGAAIVQSLGSSAAQGEVEDLTGLAPLTRRSPTRAAASLTPAQAPLFVASGERGTTDARSNRRKDNGLFVVLSDIDQQSDRRDDHRRSPG